MTGAERVETILAEQRCREVHPERWFGDYSVQTPCESCWGWGVHVAALVAAETGGLADVRAAMKRLEVFADMRAKYNNYEDAYNKGIRRVLEDLGSALLVPDQQTSEGSER